MPTTVAAALAEPGCHGMIVCGPRWVGKTSALKAIGGALDVGVFYHAVYFDPQGRGGRPLGELLEALAATIADALELPRPRSRPDFEGWLRDVWLASILVELPPDAALVLIVDEIEAVAGARPPLAAALLHPYLASLLEAHAPRLRLVLALGRRGDDLEKIARVHFPELPLCRISPLSATPRVEAALATRATEPRPRPETEAPHIEVRAPEVWPRPAEPAWDARVEAATPAADVAAQRALEAEKKARAAAERQIATIASERDVLAVEAGLARAEVERLTALLSEVTEDNERLSQRGLPPASPPPPAPAPRPAPATLPMVAAAPPTPATLPLVAGPPPTPVAPRVVSTPAPPPVVAVPPVVASPPAPARAAAPAPVVAARPAPVAAPSSPPPPAPAPVARVVPVREAKPRFRWRRLLAGLAVAAAGVAGAGFFAMRPTGFEVRAGAPALLDKGETTQVSAERVLRFGKRRAARDVAWSSTDPRVATVDARGVVTPVHTGRTRIEGRDGRLVSGVEVTVRLPERIVVEPVELVLLPDAADTPVKAAVLDGSGAPWKRPAEVTWASSDPGVATVTGGKVHRVGLGQAVITARLGELSGQVSIRSLGRREALEQACKAGTGDACVELGRLAEKGDDSPADPAGALKLYEDACAGGAMKGCIAAGEVYEAGTAGAPDVGKALDAYRKACDGKAPLGCTRLGRMLETQVHDVGKALPLYREACDAGDADGCWRLGTMIELGTGVARDAPAAVALYTKACDAGRAEACTSMAHMFWNGSGAVAKDVPAAVALFEKACAAKYGDACLFLALEYRSGQTLPDDAQKMQVFFGKACEAGHKGACLLAPKAAP